MQGIVSLSLVVIAAGCLPVTETVRDNDTVLRSFEIDGARAAPQVRVSAESTASLLTLAAESVTTCTRERHDQIKRWHDTERHTNHALHGIAYVVGILAAG